MKKHLLKFLCLALCLCLPAGCGSQGAQALPEASVSQAETGSAAAESGDFSGVATAQDMTAVEEVAEPGMTPVYADALRDGIYPVEMKSSSSMFKADHVTLVVEGGAMTARLYMTSQSYGWMFAGTAEEAAKASEDRYIPLAPAEEDMDAFSLPVEALDQGLSFAAYSVKKQLWYDRTLLFRADSLPEDAFLEARYQTPEDLGLQPGTYTVAVTLSGGSGKASVESPAELTVTEEGCTARIVWSSPNYDYMMIGEERFDPVSTEGNSVFEIPVTGFDYPMPVQADTTAMSQPYLIDYTLTFDAASVTPAS